MKVPFFSCSLFLSLLVLKSAACNEVCESNIDHNEEFLAEGFLHSFEMDDLDLKDSLDAPLEGFNGSDQIALSEEPIPSSSSGPRNVYIHREKRRTAPPQRKDAGQVQTTQSSRNRLVKGPSPQSKVSPNAPKARLEKDAAISQSRRSDAQGQARGVLRVRQAEPEFDYDEMILEPEFDDDAFISDNVETAGNQKVNSSENEFHHDIAPFNDMSFSGFYIGADFIYWKVEEDGLEYAMNGLKADSFVPTAPTTSVSKGKLHTPDFEWAPGFKVQLGYCSDAWAWDTYLNWTWLKADAHGKAKGPNAYQDNTIYTLWNPTRYLFNIAKELSPDWDLHYNTIDWLIARTFAIGKHFSLRPIAGARGGFIFQTYDIPTIGVGPGHQNRIKVHNKSDFSGGGVLGGLTTSWHFNRHFSIFNDAAFSLLYGHIDTHVKVQRTVPPTIFKQTVVHFKNECNSIKPEIELGIGFRYETNLNRNRSHLVLDVKWEYVNWFGMNTFLFPLIGTTPNAGANEPTGYSGAYERLNGNLGMMGLTIGGKYVF